MATAGVILFGVLEDILVAVALAIILFFRRSWWPPGEVLAYDDGLDGWHVLARFPEAKEAPGVVVFRWEAQLFFANAGISRQQVRRLALKRKPRWIVLQCEAITDIDVTAADMLKAHDIEFNAQGIHVAFVELRSRLHFYPSIPRALEAIAEAEPDHTIG